MNKKISIIVPVYNVEKYVAKCLDSLVNQDYDNYDVIVVNDGSPFNEQAIIDTYVAKYPNKIKSIVKENGGYGSALETAIEKSDAEYVLVCDPDDYISPKTLSTLMAYRDKNDCDLVVGAKYLVYEDSSEERYDQSFNEDFGQLIDGHKYIQGSKEFEMLYFLEPSPHAKLYRRDIIKNIKFPHKVSYTDNLLYFYTLSNVESVTYCNEALSYYLINRTGNTHTDLKPTVIDNRITVFNSIIEQVKDKSAIFCYRMLESFYFIFYQVDNIKGDNDVKKEKYELVYTFLEKLLPYKDEIVKLIKKYRNDNEVMIKQKECLLDEKLSKEYYDLLVDTRLNNSLIKKLKLRVRTMKQ